MGECPVTNSAGPAIRPNTALAATTAGLAK